MPLPSAIKLFIDPKLGLAFGNFAGSSQISNPTFTLGDTAGIEIYLVESTQVASYPRQELPFPVSPGVKVAVGDIDESPTAGTWLMAYGGNTTSALPYNATAAQLQAALNALASITSAGGVTVSKIGDNYNIAFNTAGVRTELTTDSTSLIPLSTAVVATLQAGTISKPQISLVHLQKTVAGLATTFTQTSASQITVESLGAWDGSKATFRVSISPDPKGGTFTLGFDALTGDDVSTASINVGASGQDVQNALNIKALLDKVAVSQVGAYAYDISVSTQPGTNGLTANAAGLLSFSGYKGDLSLNTAEAISLLDGAESVETTLEVEITSDTKTLTLLQIPCTLKNAVIDAGSVEPLVLDTYLSQTTADGRYLRQSNNLSDLGSATTARTNLAVYSTSQVDTALALKADDSDLLLKADLAGAAFTGAVTTTDRMAIGGGLANNTAHKLAIYNGNVVFSAGFGVAFGDGTTQTTAATTPNLSGYATQSWVQGQGYLTFYSYPGIEAAIRSSKKDYGSLPSGQAGDINQGGNTQINVTSSSVYDDGLVIQFVGSTSYYYNFTTSSGVRTLTINFNSNDDAGQITLQINNLNIPNLTFTYTDGGSPPYYEYQTGMTLALPVIQVATTDQFIYDLNNGMVKSALAAEATADSVLFKSATAAVQWGKPWLGMLNNATLSGITTFTGKANTLAPTSTNAGLNIGSINSTANLTNSVAGDVWIGTWQMAYKTANGTLVYGAATNASNVFGSPQIIDTTATTAGLRITQKGTGNAIEVEDSTSPDSTRFVVDQFGKVGVGIAPDATAALRVDANGIRFNTGSTQTVAFIDAPSDGNYYVRRNGAWYLCGLHTNGGVTYLTI